MAGTAGDKRIASIFAAHDVDGSGALDPRELRPALAQLGVHLSNDDTTALLQRADVDKSGGLSMSEFRAVFSLGRLRAVFDAIDVDRDGCVSPKELGAALQKHGEAEDHARLLQKIDANGDRCVDFHEFCGAFRFLPFASVSSVTAAWQTLPALDCGSDLVPPLPQEGVPLAYGIFGGVAGMASKTSTAPLERVKIVAQTATSPVNIAKEIVTTRKKYGIHGLFAGNTANCVRVFPYAGVALLTYLTAIRFTPADTVLHDSVEPFCRALAAAGAGIVGQVCTYPLDVVRARMTLNPGGYLGVIDCARSLLRARGPRGMYAGFGPTVVSVAPFFATQMVTADALKEELAEHDVEITALVMLAVGAVAGAAAQTVVYPLDLIRRRMQVGDGHLSFRQTARRAMADRGLQGLFQGIGPTYAKVVPAVAVAMSCSKAMIDVYNRMP